MCYVAAKKEASLEKRLKFIILVSMPGENGRLISVGITYFFPNGVSISYLFPPPNLNCRLTCGTTWHSAGMLNSVKGNANEAFLHQQTKAVLATIEAETGVSPGHMKHGGLTITRNQERMQEFK